MFKNVCFLERKKHSYYSSSKYVFILLHLFVFFVLYEEKLARLFLYNLKHRPNDLTYIETTQYLFRWEVRLPNKRPSDLEVQHQRLCICDLTGIAIKMTFQWYSFTLTIHPPTFFSLIFLHYTLRMNQLLVINNVLGIWYRAMFY